MTSLGENAQRTQEAEILRLKEALGRAEDLLAESIRTQADLRAEISAMTAEAPVQVDAESIRAEIARAEQVNRKVSEAQARAADRIRYTELQEEYNAKGRELEACDRDKLELFKSAQYPYKGLEYSDEGVLLGCVPFAQASTAEQLRASVAIGLASEPQLRVMLVRDGSLLDSASMAELATIAQERDCQLWLEVVAERGPGGQYPEGLELIIEDGARLGSESAEVNLFAREGAQ